MITTSNSDSSGNSCCMCPEQVIGVVLEISFLVFKIRHHCPPLQLGFLVRVSGYFSFLRNVIGGRIPPVAGFNGSRPRSGCASCCRESPSGTARPGAPMSGGRGTTPRSGCGSAQVPDTAGSPTTGLRSGGAGPRAADQARVPQSTSRPVAVQ